MKSVSSIADWIRPSYLNLETEKLLASPEMSDVVELGANICEWTHELTGNERAEEIGEKLEVFEKFFAVPGAFEKAGKLKASWERWLDGGPVTPIVENGLLLTNKVAKSAQFFDATGIAPLKEGLRTAKGFFWGTLGIFDSIQVVKSISEAGKLDKQIKETADREEKTIIEHRWQIAFLNVIKSVNTIAQSVIALISIFFVSLAQGIIFSPIVFLGLTSTWLALNFGVHFYDKIVDQWDVERKARAKAPQIGLGT
ncbi:MAG: hypothetical protein JSS30_07695 [Verrucomicrobia bacterium]|nr:hypothetical protein [Verrucomicrobiota bacterium]